MTVVPPIRRAHIAASLRAHRRLVAILTLLSVVVLAAFEIGVRVVSPDTMEAIEYGSPAYGESANAVTSRYVITDPAQIAMTYQALTQTSADWATQFDTSAIPPTLQTCQQRVLSRDLTTRTHLLIIRFLWHDHPVAVFTHYPIQDNPYWLWTCQGNMTEWQMSAGGIINPRPYVDDSVLSLFPLVNA